MVGLGCVFLNVWRVLHACLAIVDSVYCAIPASMHSSATYLAPNCQRAFVLAQKLRLLLKRLNTS